MLSIPLSARNTKSGYKSRDISDSLMDQSTDSYTYYLLGDLEDTANIYCISRNLPKTDTQNYSTDLR